MSNTAVVEHSLDKHSMFDLLDFTETLRVCGEKLNKYKKAFREAKKKANPGNKKVGLSGGVTASNYAVLEALLRILPSGMDWVKANRIGIFRKCKKENLYAVIVTAKSVQANTFSRSGWDDSVERFEVGRTTVFSSYKVLKKAGIIKETKTIVNPQNAKKKATLIYLDASAVAIFPIRESLPEPPSHASDSKEKFSEQPPAPCEKTKVQILNYYKEDIQSLNKENNTRNDVEKVSSSDDDIKMKAEKVRSTDSRTLTKENFAAARGPAELLWKNCLHSLYPGQSFDFYTENEAISMLEGHLQGVKIFVQGLRADLIAEFTKTEKYLAKPEKARTAYLKWFTEKALYKPLRDADQCALSIILEAIKVFKGSADHGGFSAYHPKAFLREDYGLNRSIRKVMQDIIRECRTPILSKSEIIKLKASLRGFVSSFAALSLKDISFAVLQTDTYLENAKKLLRESESLDNQQKQHYYSYFKQQILKILESHGKLQN